MIRADRITGITCDVNGDSASGVVKYQVPGLYEGETRYRAEMKNGDWYITELMMTDLKIHLVRADKGLWKRKPSDSE